MRCGPLLRRVRGDDVDGDDVATAATTAQFLSIAKAYYGHRSERTTAGLSKVALGGSPTHLLATGIDGSQRLLAPCDLWPLIILRCTVEEYRQTGGTRGRNLLAHPEAVTTELRRHFCVGDSNETIAMLRADVGKVLEVDGKPCTMAWVLAAVQQETARVKADDLLAPFLTLLPTAWMPVELDAAWLQRVANGELHVALVPMSHIRRILQAVCWSRGSYSYSRAQRRADGSVSCIYQCRRAGAAAPTAPMAQSAAASTASTAHTAAAQQVASLASLVGDGKRAEADDDDDGSADDDIHYIAREEDLTSSASEVSAAGGAASAAPSSIGLLGGIAARGRHDVDRLGRRRGVRCDSKLCIEMWPASAVSIALLRLSTCHRHHFVSPVPIAVQQAMNDAASECTARGSCSERCLASWHGGWSLPEGQRLVNEDDAHRPVHPHFALTMQHYRLNNIATPTNALQAACIENNAIVAQLDERHQRVLHNPTEDPAVPVTGTNPLRQFVSPPRTSGGSGLVVSDELRASLQQAAAAARAARASHASSASASPEADEAVRRQQQLTTPPALHSRPRLLLKPLLL